MKKKTNKPRVKYLDINEKIYIENDIVKTKLNETNTNDIGTWDDVWIGVMEIIEKYFRQYIVVDPN
jgi:hypothetical protein